MYAQLRRVALLATVVAAWLAGDRAAAQKDSFQFVVLGDRTGDAQPGVYESVFRQAAAEAPAFVISVGDSIEGTRDSTAEAQWAQFEQIVAPYRRLTLLLAPGNHDIWSPRSEALFREHAARPPHYGFDYRGAHITVLDNSRTEQLAAVELRFLEGDLEAHKDQPVKFIVFHRPSWLIDTMFQNPHFAVHQLATKYGVQYVISGHVHQMLETSLEDVTYVSMASSGGHLRGSGRYEDGWFFGYAVVGVRGKDVDFHIKEVKPPLGRGRVSELSDWRKAGAGARAVGSH